MSGFGDVCWVRTGRRILADLRLVDPVDRPSRSGARVVDAGNVTLLLT